MDRTYIGTSLNPMRWDRKHVLWLSVAGMCIGVWSYIESSYLPLVAFAVMTMLSFIINLPAHQREIAVILERGALSIYEGRAILWKVQIKDIASVKFEENKGFLSLARKALLIRTYNDDSYYLPLDGITFGDVDIEEIVTDLNRISSEYA